MSSLVVELPEDLTGERDVTWEGWRPIKNLEGFKGVKGARAYLSLEPDEEGLPVFLIDFVEHTTVGLLADDEVSNPVDDLADAIRDIISVYSTGHDILAYTVVGLLHCLANECIIDHNLVDYMETDDDIDEDDEWELT